MRYYFILIAIIALLSICCAHSDDIKSNSDPEILSKERPAPVEIFIFKASGDAPVEIQVVNRTKNILTLLGAELTFENGSTGDKCKIEVLVIGDKWATIGDSRRARLMPNSTDLFEIELIELSGEECWQAIINAWDEIEILGKIKDTEYLKI